MSVKSDLLFQTLAAEGLTALKQTLVVGRCIHRDGSDWEAAFGDVVSYRAPPDLALHSICLDKYFSTQFLLPNTALNLPFTQLIEQYLQPAVEHIAWQIDSAILSTAYVVFPHFTDFNVFPGGESNIARFLAKAGKQLAGDRTLILSPKGEREALDSGKAVYGFVTSAAHCSAVIRRDALALMTRPLKPEAYLKESGVEMHSAAFDGLTLRITAQSDLENDGTAVWLSVLGNIDVLDRDGGLIYYQ